MSRQSTQLYSISWRLKGPVIPVYMSATPVNRHPLSSYTEVIEGA